MEKRLVGLIMIILLASCSNENKMKSEIKTYLDKNAKDPKSYELIDLKVVDTVTVGEIANALKENNDSYIKDTQGDIEDLEKVQKKNVFYNKKYPHEFDSLIKENREQIRDYNVLIKETNDDNKELLKHLRASNILGYMVRHKYRLKNGFGALDITEKLVLYNKDYVLVNFDATYLDERMLFRKVILK